MSGGDAAEDPYPGRQRGRQSRSSSSRGSSSSRSSSSRSSSSGGSRRTGRTKAELYQEAKRLGIEGRSQMSKQQLEQAVSRGGRESDEVANPVTVQAFLEGVNYPSKKGELLREAKRQRASEDVRATIEQLPDRSFDDPTEVSEAIGRME